MRERERHISRFGGSTNTLALPRLCFRRRRAESIFVVRGFLQRPPMRHPTCFFHLSRSAISNVIMLTTTTTTICFVLASLLLFGGSVECQNGAWTLGEKNSNNNNNNNNNESSSGVLFVIVLVVSALNCFRKSGNRKLFPAAKISASVSVVKKKSWDLKKVDFVVCLAAQQSVIKTLYLKSWRFSHRHGQHLFSWGQSYITFRRLFRCLTPLTWLS